MKCICGCDREVESKRKDARYYSPGCRVKALRNVTKVDDGVTDNANHVTDNVTDNHPDRDNIYSRHFDISEAGFIRRNKAWLDASRFSGTPAQQEAQRVINRAAIRADNIRINREHVANAISEAARRMKWEKVAEAMRKVEG